MPNVNVCCMHNTGVGSMDIKLKPGAILAIACHDNEPGTSASFSFRAKSSNKNSAWNFELSHTNAKQYVKAFGIDGKNATHKKLCPEVVIKIHLQIGTNLT
eukprot:UN13313